MLELARKTSVGRRLIDGERLAKEAGFLRSWIEKPLLTGAVAPSGKALAQTMASYIDPRALGPIVELGPGTGPVTEALIGRGIEQERLVLVEYNPDFAKLLARRFPRATIVQGDAYDVAETLDGIVTEPCGGFVSSLPLLTKPPEQRLALMRAAHALSRPYAPFVQFTYGVAPPIPPRARDYTSSASERIWRNVPPARVWVYRRR